MSPKNTRKSDTRIQGQSDSVITNQDLPDKRLRCGLTLVILTTGLFVVALYYGIINP